MALLDVGGGFSSWEYECWTAVGMAERLIASGEVSDVVCESFTIAAHTAKKTRQYWSLESIGAIRWACMKAGVSFTLQSPADAKGFATDAKLKALGWYTPTKDGHANDAARHLLKRAIDIGAMSVDDLMGRMNG